MSDAMHPIVMESLRDLPVSSSEMSLIIGKDQSTITAIDWYQYQVGERVKVTESLGPLNDHKPLWCFRYITSIRPMMAMMGDENIMEYELCVFNTSVL